MPLWKSMKSVCITRDIRHIYLVSTKMNSHTVEFSLCHILCGSVCCVRLVSHLLPLLSAFLFHFQCNVWYVSLYTIQHFMYTIHFTVHRHWHFIPFRSHYNVFVEDSLQSLDNRCSIQMENLFCCFYRCWKKQHTVYCVIVVFSQ